MNISFLNTFESTGGAAIAGNRLVKALNGKQVSVTNLVLYPGSNPSSNTVSIARNKFWRFIGLSKLSLEKGLFYFREKSPDIRFQFSTNRAGFDVSRYPVIQHADIIHLHWFHQGLLSLDGFARLVQLNTPMVWTLHDMWAFTGGCHYAGRCDHFKEACGNCPYLKRPHPHDLSYVVHTKKSKIYEQANLSIVTCSKWLANKARESSLLADLPITNIPNPIDTEKFKPQNKTKIRKELGLPVEKKIILFGAAKLTDGRKGFKYLIHALKKLADSKPELTSNLALLVFGSTDEALSRLLPFPLISLGSIDYPENAYNAADVFVLPSLEDNLPNTVMEALACGVPCVGFNTGGVPEMIDHKHNGYVAAYKSDEDLLTGINWILQEADYKQLAVNARRKVMENYTEEIVAGQYIEIYKSMLKSE